MIPATAHFIWFGRKFPYIYGLALRSAATLGGFGRVVLHHEDDIDASPGWSVAKGIPSVEKRRLDPIGTLSSIPGTGRSLATLYQKLTQPAARSNMIRAALLYLEGGVYLDTDILCTGSFGPLLDTRVFCGEERIVFPHALRNNRNPAAHLAALSRFVIRDLCRRMPSGWQRFRQLESHYPSVVNNAVLGSEEGNDTIGRLLEAMVRLSPRRQLKRYALGTHLLETAVANRPSEFTVYPSRYFYPVGPEISEHWFKRTRNADHRALLFPETVAVHWYASVRTKRYVNRFNDTWIQRYATKRPLCSLAAEVSAARTPRPKI